MHEQQINEVNNADYISDEHTYAIRTNQFTHCHSSLSASSTISHNLENANSKNSSNKHTYSSINISGPLRKDPYQGSISKTLPANDTVQIEDEATIIKPKQCQQTLRLIISKAHKIHQEKDMLNKIYTIIHLLPKNKTKEKNIVSFYLNRRKNSKNAVGNLVCHMKCQNKMKLI